MHWAAELLWLINFGICLFIALMHWSFAMERKVIYIDTARMYLYNETLVGVDIPDLKERVDARYQAYRKSLMYSCIYSFISLLYLAILLIR